MISFYNYYFCTRLLPGSASTCPAIAGHWLLVYLTNDAVSTPGPPVLIIRKVFKYEGILCGDQYRIYNEVYFKNSIGGLDLPF